MKISRGRFWICRTVTAAVIDSRLFIFAEDLVRIFSQQETKISILSIFAVEDVGVKLGGGMYSFIA